MSYIEILSNGKPQVKAKEAFCELLNMSPPPSNKSLIELFNEFDVIIKSQHKAITTGALNKIHGDWYEWILAIEMWNYRIRNDSNQLILNLPNVSQFDCSRLYKHRLSSLIDDLKIKISESTNVQLISSNPDYVIIDTQNMILDNRFNTPITRITPDTIDMISSAYKDFIDKCDFNDLIGYVSVKTSFRPDRRLQIAHEGSLMKALYIHLQTRQWIIHPQGLKYYAIAREVKDVDRNALKTVATHSITTVHSIPQSAVDEVFQIDSLDEAQTHFAEIIN